MAPSPSPSTISSTLTPLKQDPDRLEARLNEIPPNPGVYFMKDAQDNILYIGKSKKLRSRVRSYFRDMSQLSARIGQMVLQVVDIDFIVTDTEAEALALESNLIKQHQPRFNVLLKDDKKYPYLCITWSEDYPRIFVTRRRRGSRAKRDRYYGPYVNVGAMRRTLGIVKRLFPLRQRKKPMFKDRPCLNYDMGRCPGVCQNLIAPEEYHKTMQKVAMIFQGRTKELEEILTQQMAAAAEVLNYEVAARIRDQIRGIQSLGADQKVNLPNDTVMRDAIALMADDNHACVQLFQIRAGKLVGHLGFVADAQAGTPGTILQRVLEEHYQQVDPLEIPSDILVQHELPEQEILAAYLSERRGRKVSIYVPQRQTKADLIEMVERNAGYELARTQRFAERNNQAMLDLADILDLPDLPHRIEGYDISHIQGSDAVASQVVFIDGLPAKQHYRHYKIKNPTVRSGHSDDFASMAEVIRRRFKRYAKVDKVDEEGNIDPSTDRSLRTGIKRKKQRVTAPTLPLSTNATNSIEQDADFPDLVMIDGGKGQLSAVVEVLKEMNLLEDVKVVSLAKQREEIFLPGESKPLVTESEQPGVQLLRRLRDEAHRFAVSFHRKKRTDRMRRSRLDDIPGLGHARKKELLAYFRSIDYIREASAQQISEVQGIGPRLAQQIYDYFHPFKETTKVGLNEPDLNELGAKD